MNRSFVVYLFLTVVPFSACFVSVRGDDNDAIKRIEGHEALKSALQTKLDTEMFDIQTKANREKELIQRKADTEKQQQKDDSEVQAIQREADTALDIIQKKADADQRIVQSNVEPELKVARERLVEALLALHASYEQQGKSLEAAGIAYRLRRAQNLLVNGGFEEGPPSPFDGHSNIDLVAGEHFIGWNIARERAGIVDSSYFKPAESKRCVAIPFAGAIEQTFATQKGVRYKVTFRMAGDPLGNLGEKKLQLSAGANRSPVFVFDTTGSSRTDMKWEHKVWMFTADSDFTRLEISGIDHENYGPAIDDVVVVELKPAKR